RDAPAQLLDFATARAYEVPRPVDVATVGHRDDEPGVGAERDHGRAIAPSTLAAHVMHDGQRGHEPRERSHDGVGEQAVHAPHEAGDVHAARLAPERAVSNPNYLTWRREGGIARIWTSTSRRTSPRSSPRWMRSSSVTSSRSS